MIAQRPLQECFEIGIFHLDNCLSPAKVFFVRACNQNSLGYPRLSQVVASNTQQRDRRFFKCTCNCESKSRFEMAP